jgi:hypothetical protein
VIGLAFIIVALVALLWGYALGRIHGREVERERD